MIPVTVDLQKLLTIPENRAIVDAAAKDPEIITDYASRATDPPPITLYGSRIADGAHRVLVALQQGKTTIPATRWWAEGQWAAEPNGQQHELQVEEQFQSVLKN
jgi:hypothetical protein